MNLGTFSNVNAAILQVFVRWVFFFFFFVFWFYSFYQARQTWRSFTGWPLVIRTQTIWFCWSLRVFLLLYRYRNHQSSLRSTESGPSLIRGGLSPWERARHCISTHPPETGFSGSGAPWRHHCHTVIFIQDHVLFLLILKSLKLAISPS